MHLDLSISLQFPGNPGYHASGNRLALGADDYITKPFRPLELAARVKSQLRRYKKYNPAHSGQEQDVLSTRLTIPYTGLRPMGKRTGTAMSMSWGMP